MASDEHRPEGTLSFRGEPRRSTTFDELFATLPQPVMGRPTEYAKLSTDTILLLRSVGGMSLHR